METIAKSVGDAPKKLSRSQRRRRDDIVQAAMKVFERDGYEAAKMVDIAKEAEVAKGTLYLYFETKAALLEGVIQSVILPALEQIGEAAKTLFHAHVVRKGLDLIRSTLKAGVESGEFRKEAADLNPLVFVGAHVYAAVWHKRLVDDNLTLVMGGLVAHR